MDVTCPNCHTTLRIADDKLPDSGNIRLKCPSCSSPVSVALGEKQTPSDMPAPAAQPTPSAPPVPSAPKGDTEQMPTEFFAPDANVAFVLVQDARWKETVKAFFEAHDFDMSEAEDEATAVGKLRMNSYDVVVLEDTGPGRQALAEINSWSGTQRRELNVILLGRDPSRSPDAAFLHGVNYCINSGDAARADNLLDEALRQFEMHYLPVAKAKKGME